MKATPLLTRERILKSLQKNRPLLSKRFSVKRIGLFGSYATGRQKRGSDIDFIVEFERPTYDNFCGLIEFLEKLFGRKVDVLTPIALDTMRVEEVARNIRESVVYA